MTTEGLAATPQASPPRPGASAGRERARWRTALSVGGVAISVLAGLALIGRSDSPQPTAPASDNAPSTSGTTMLATSAPPPAQLAPARPAAIASTTTSLESTSFTATTTTTAPVSAASGPATLPDGSPVPLLAVFNGDLVTLEGAVPSEHARAYVNSLAAANAKATATIDDRLTIDPSVPLAVPVRVIELQSVRFPSGSAEIVPEHAAELDRVANVMFALPHVTVLVVGHSDQVGSDEANLALSQARAGAVVDYLIGKGVAAARLSSRGVGETDLLADDLGGDALALNRRTEFVFTGILVPV